MTRNPTLEQKVEHLQDPGSYPDRPASVESRETHMSWVFLVGELAYKMKKPRRTEAFDLQTLEARRADCQREVQLNRRLAPFVYYGVVPLALSSPDGGGEASEGSRGRASLRLEGTGPVVDWLIKMRRLPESRMLDWLIEHGCLQDGDLRRALTPLCRFYRHSPPLQRCGRRYRERLIEDLDQSRDELLVPRFGQSPPLVRRIHETLRQYVARDASLLDQRAAAGRVIDAHGDLRPEHICLESPPVIIDCLQFDRRLRTLDSASEMAFLSLELDVLRAFELQRSLWSTYRDQSADHPPRQLIQFYKAYHACLRAMVAVWHLKDDVRDPDKWTGKADRYLRAAETVAHRLSQGG